MLTELKNIVNELENSAVYKDWHATHKDAFLSSMFIVDEQGWQLAFYSPSNKKISTFLKDKLIQSDSSIFKLENENINPLIIDDIKIGLEEAKIIADHELANNHPGYKKVKEIIVLQKFENVLWNLTYLTTSFHIFNIKINAVNNNIISQDFISSMFMNPKKNPNLP